MESESRIIFAANPEVSGVQNLQSGLGHLSTTTLTIKQNNDSTIPRLHDYTITHLNDSTIDSPPIQKKPWQFDIIQQMAILLPFSEKNNEKPI